MNQVPSNIKELIENAIPDLEDILKEYPNTCKGIFEDAVILINEQVQQEFHVWNTKGKGRYNTIKDIIVKELAGDYMTSIQIYCGNENPKTEFILDQLSGIFNFHEVWEPEDEDPLPEGVEDFVSKLVSQLVRKLERQDYGLESYIRLLAFLTESDLYELY